jgi:phage-related protein
VVTRSYDVKLILDSAAGFVPGNVVVGNSSITVATINAVDYGNNVIKVLLANSLQEFATSEYIHSNSATVSGNSFGVLNSDTPFIANTFSGNVTTAIAQILSIENNRLTYEKNSLVQNPIVRMLSIYYPGEWYPPNNNGNPSGKGDGRGWPNGFPLRIAQIVGDTSSDLLYNVTFGGESYTPYPINITPVSQASDGKINELSIELYNLNGIVSAIVENPYISGNNISNAAVALVNGELIHGIDPRTINVIPQNIGPPGSEERIRLEKARSDGLVYDQDLTFNYYGTANASFTYEQTQAVNGTWIADTFDSRDLLGAVVQIKTTFANFLDYWPEYSTVSAITDNVITVRNTSAYRVGDNVFIGNSSSQFTIQAIIANNVYVNTDVSGNVDEALYIVTPEADSESFIEDTYKIDQLESLGEDIATFGLVSWLQYFKNVIPRRRYYKNTCQWVYKGEECQYPDSGTGTIPGTVEAKVPSQANGFFTASNASTSDPALDICSKSFKACQLRNNIIHFGGFPGTGRRVPKL